MAAKSYRNFDLLIEAAEAGSFRARVTSCPLGESPSARFRLPFDATQLENLMLKLDPGRSGTRRAGADPQSQASMDLGGPLFESVFSEDLMLAWSRSQDVTRAAGEGLRLRLRLTDAPSIAGLPWELLYDRRSNGYIAQSERTPVVRYLEVPHPPRPLMVDGALRILVVISSPTDLPELDVEAEWRRVQDALAVKVGQGTVRIDRLPAPTIGALSTWLRTNDVHILHFIGHGDYDERIQDGVLYFCDKYGRSSKVAPSVLGPFLHDHDPLRLVLLNACQSARVDAKDPFSGMAQGLVQQDVTAVVAMQFPISDGAAVAFTGEFYSAVADGIPVDQAATWARKGLLADYPGEWATPVLFLRAPDGRVFDHIVAETVAQAVAAPVAEPVAQPVVEPVAEPDPQPAAEPVAEPVEVPGAPDFVDDVAEPRNDALALEPAEATTQSAATSDGGPPVTQPVPIPLTGPVRSWPAPTQQPDEPVRLYASGRGYLPPQPSQQPPRRRGRALAVVATLIIIVVSAVGYLAWYGSAHPDGGGGGGGQGDQVAGTTTLTGPKITATKLTTGLTIDGDISDWPSDAKAFDSNAIVFGDKPDFKASWALAWDADALYLVADVTDSTLLQVHQQDTSQLWKGDGVSFELGTPVPQNDNKRLENGDRHVMLAPATFTDAKVLGAINVVSGATFVRGANSIQGAAAAAVATEHGYRIEAQIPWSTLGVSGAGGGSEIGMNLNASDTVQSGPRRGELGAMVSNNPARHNNDASLRSQWGTLTLEG